MSKYNIGQEIYYISNEPKIMKAEIVGDISFTEELYLIQPIKGLQVAIHGDNLITDYNEAIKILLRRCDSILENLHKKYNEEVNRIKETIVEYQGLDMPNKV